MKDLPKIKVIILIVIFLLLLIFGIAGFALLGREYQKTQTLSKELEQLSADKSIIEQDLKTTKQKTTKLDQALRRTNDKIKILSNQIEDEKTSNKDLHDQLESVKSQLTTEKSAKNTLEKRISRLQGDLENFLSRFKDLEQEKVDLEMKLKQYDSNVELDTIIVGSKKTDQTTITKLSGTIVKLNKEYEFLIINIGQDQGVNDGDIFTVYHTGKAIGDIEIEKANPTMSAANFLPNLKTKIIRESDTVVKKD